MTTKAAVDAERERRKTAGVAFRGKTFQTRDQDLAEIVAAAHMAAVATAPQMSGVTGYPVDANMLRWHGGDEDFAWVAEDNTLVPMDAATVIELARAVTRHRGEVALAARAMKDRIDAGEAVDPLDPANWPA